MANERLVESLVEQVQDSIQNPIAEEHLESLGENIKGHWERAGKLREVPLENADEPDFVFHVYREEE